MKKMKSIYILGTAVMLLLTSACGNTTESRSPSSTPSEQKHVDQQKSKKEKTESPIKQVPILIIIDQTKQEGFEGNMFYFSIEQVPEGYALAEMQWISDKNRIVNTFKEAFENGASEGDGFYISGNGQYSGFIYNDKMKGEQGQVVFVFRNDGKEEVTWKQNITLK